MIRNRTAHSLSLALAVVLLACAASGCASAKMQFFTLASLATPGAEPPAKYSVLVGPVTIPPALDRPQFVVQVAPNQVEIDELNCWASPLHDGIARAVAGNLAVLLATHDVGVVPLANFKATHRVTLNVQRFDSLPGKSVSVHALWTVSPTAVGARASSGRTVAEEAVTGSGYDALAAAHSRILAKMSAEIADAIVEGGQKKH